MRDGHERGQLGVEGSALGETLVLEEQEPWFGPGDGEISLASLRGKAVVLNFWASWCEPCKSEAPRFQQAFRRYGNRVAFVGVDTADYSSDAGRFLSRYGVTYPNVRDPDRSVLGKYGGLPIPRTFVISPTWRVTGYIFGEARSEEIDSAIQEALGA